jgi:hypothetical protein
MKKTALALVAAIALVLGSGSMVSSANAAVYPNTINTKTTISAANSVTEGKRLSVVVRVRAGNAVVREGTVTAVFGGRRYTAKVRSTSVKFKIKAPSVKKTSSKTLKVTYRPAPNSVFKASSASDKIKIKNKKKK